MLLQLLPVRACCAQVNLVFSQNMAVELCGRKYLVKKPKTWQEWKENFERKKIPPLYHSQSKDYLSSWQDKSSSPLQTVPAVNYGGYAPERHAGKAAQSFLIGYNRSTRHQGWVPRRNFENPSVYHHTVSRTVELSLQSSFQLSLTVLVRYRTRVSI